MSASCSFQSIPERMISASENPGSERLMEHRCVYIFQREYATVDPAYVDVCSISVLFIMLSSYQYTVYFVQVCGDTN